MSLASATASSSSSKTVSEATGPNVSSRQATVSSLIPLITVGW